MKRSKHKLKLTDIVIRKSDKSRVFYFDKLENHRKKSEEYMERTRAHKCLGIARNEPLTIINYNTIRQKVINSPIKKKYQPIYYDQWNEPKMYFISGYLSTGYCSV
ncbi:unnamed protein product [Rotaria sp. Silwood1]|nr:unnamed protein product [Rotaria sp. Silwood1]